MKKNRKIAVVFVLFLLLGTVIWAMFFRQAQSNITVPQQRISHMELPPFDESIAVASTNAEDSTLAGDTSSQPLQAQQDKLRGVWISYLDLKELFANKDAASFRAAFTEICNFCVQTKINTMVIQVRPFSDAIYPSSIFPWSHIISGTQGQDPGYDPLSVMITLAKEYGLKVHAWLNPYRIKTAEITMSEKNPALQFLNDENKKHYVKEYGGGFYYDPSAGEVQTLICDGIRELVQNYDINGVHFDDYFYPTTDAGFDQAQYDAYRQAGGQADLAAWRQDNVNSLVKKCYETIKSIKPEVLFGISPAGNIEKVCNDMYADVKLWAKEPGYIDYICPQLYYGFENDAQPFDAVYDQWKTLYAGDAPQIYIGLPFYKVGNEDKWAGSGANEFVQNDDALIKMIEKVQADKDIAGYVLYDLRHMRETNAVSAKVLERLKKAD